MGLDYPQESVSDGHEQKQGITAVTYCSRKFQIITARYFYQQTVVQPTSL